MALLVRCEMKGGGDFGRFGTTVDDIGVYKRCTVIRRAALCNRLSGERGSRWVGLVFGGSAWWGVTRWRRLLEVGMCKNDGIDDEFMQL